MVSFSEAKFVDMKDGNVELALNIKVHEQKLNGNLEHTAHIIRYLLQSFVLIS